MSCFEVSHYVEKVRASGKDENGARGEGQTIVDHLVLVLSGQTVVCMCGNWKHSAFKHQSFGVLLTLSHEPEAVS